MKIDQVSCTAHYFCKVDVQGTHIIGRIVDVGAGGRQCSLSDNVFWPLVAPTTKADAAQLGSAARRVAGAGIGGRQKRRRRCPLCARTASGWAPGSPRPGIAAGRASCRRAVSVAGEHALRASAYASVDKLQASFCSFLDQKTVITKDLIRQDCVAVFPASNITARPIEACNSSVNHRSTFRLRTHPRSNSEAVPSAFHRRSWAPKVPSTTHAVNPGVDAACVETGQLHV